MDELIMYILVNKDIPMSSGKTSAQVAHCAINYMEQLFMYGVYDYLTYRAWKMRGQKKIVLQASQSFLEELEKSNKFSKLAIRDNGLTEIPPNSLTAICLGINTRENFYQELPKLKRLRLL